MAQHYLKKKTKRSIQPNRTQNRARIENKLNSLQGQLDSLKENMKSLRMEFNEQKGKMNVTKKTSQKRRTRRRKNSDPANNPKTEIEDTNQDEWEDLDID